MSDELDELLRADLRAWESAGLTRRLTDDAEPGTPRGDFRSNDYLGLARDERVLAAAHAALAEHGAGGRAARLLGGGSPLAARVERAVAEWLAVESALLFPSGYQANLGVVGALAGRGDALFSDELNHASLVDACRLSRARVTVFRHLDCEELARALGLARGARRRFVVTESIFSMDGDLAPLAKLHELCERHDAWLIVDEAHAIGLLGAEGAGACAAAGIGGGRERPAQRLAARMLTGGKSLGVGGAFVAGSAALRDTLLQQARSFLFTTAPPPMVAGALLAAIDACRRADAERARTLALAQRIASRLGLPRPAAAIVPVVIGDAKAAVESGERLLRDGFEVGAVRPPTVPEGGSRLRIVAHAFNDERDVDRLVALVGGDVRAATATAAEGSAAALAPAWFVVGTDTGVGKTVVSALLLRAARQLGRALYWKPVQTGADDDRASVRALAQASDDELLPNGLHFPLAASPHAAAAAAGRAIDAAALARRLTELRRASRNAPLAAAERPARIVVELAGGLLVPYRAGAAPIVQADWLATAGARVVVVARSGLGTLNHTLLTLEALRARHLEPDALFLVGDSHASNVATLRELAGVARIFELPRFAPLDGAALERWLADHDLGALLGRAP